LRPAPWADSLCRMTECIAAVLGFWLSLAPWYQDRDMSAEARDALLRPLASVVCQATDDPGERAFLATQAYHETHLAAYVLEGRCHQGPEGARCDNGRAWGAWQVHRWARGAWDETASLESRRLSAARFVLRGWRRGMTQGGPAHGFQRQRSEADPRPWAVARVRLWRVALAALSAPSPRSR